MPSRSMHCARLQWRDLRWGCSWCCRGEWRGRCRRLQHKHTAAAAAEEQSAVADGADAWRTKRTRYSEPREEARPAASPSPFFVPGLPHAVLIKLVRALLSYQDCRMLS